MAFESFAEFVSMDGHGLYVWLAYGVGLITIIYNVWMPRQHGRSLIARIRRQVDRENQS